MLKVWWFPEYSPQVQIVFDDIKNIIEKTYRSFGYLHVQTPAVERNEILLKGGESSSKEVFGLYGMASWADDLKKYWLRFDLTIPFARYVLDRQNELVFPFKRYQVQPVWRGERAQRGRYREFYQADLDAIWRQDTDENTYLFLDAELIYALRLTLEKIRVKYLANKQFVTHINNRNILRGLFDSVTDDALVKQQLSKLFDCFYKIGEKEFYTQLETLIGSDGKSTILGFLMYGIDELQPNFVDNDIFAQWVTELKEVFRILRMLNTELSKEVFVYDPFIVRGLDYYTGTVFENLLPSDMAMGSICSWGRYANLTQALDEKSAQFDGVGWSIGLSRLFTLVEERIKNLNTRKQWYLFLHFPETLPTIIQAARKMKAKWWIVEIYPGDDKLKKQFSYADKLWIKEVVIIGTEEAKQGVFKIKNMETGDEKSYPMSQLESTKVEKKDEQ